MFRGSSRKDGVIKSNSRYLWRGRTWQRVRPFPLPCIPVACPPQCLGNACKTRIGVDELILSNIPVSSKTSQRIKEYFLKSFMKARRAAGPGF